jgi:Cdc6-like AAA superfamily ATPase
MVVVPFKKDNVMKTTESVKSVELVQPKMITPISEDVFIPQNDPYYVRWGNHKDVESIIKSGMFYPVFITGLSGNGKTTMVEQACAKLKKKYIRVQITPETDEDDLIGGFRLVHCCFLMKLTVVLIALCVCNQFLKVNQFLSKRQVKLYIQSLDSM